MTAFDGNEVNFIEGLRQRAIYRSGRVVHICITRTIELEVQFNAGTEYDIMLRWYAALRNCPN